MTFLPRLKLSTKCMISLHQISLLPLLEKNQEINQMPCICHIYPSLDRRKSIDGGKQRRFCGGKFGPV
jgi:hypothetical protein